MMILRRSILPMLWCLLAIPSYAQSEGEEAIPFYRSTIEMTFGVGFPLGNGSLEPGGPIHLLDSLAPGPSFGMAYTFWVNRNVGIGLAVDNPYMEGREEWERETQLVKEAYPDSEVLRAWGKPLAVGVVGVGITYRIAFGDLSLEPSLFGCYLGVDSSRLDVDLKTTGANEYRTVSHRADDVETFTVVPALALRYVLRPLSDHLAIHLRGSFIYKEFNTLHTITESTTPGDAVSSSAIINRTIRTAVFGAGVSYQF